MYKLLSCIIVFVAAFIFLNCPTVCFSADETVLNIEEVIGKLESLRGQSIKKEDTSGIVPSYRYFNSQRAYYEEVHRKEAKGEGVVVTVYAKSGKDKVLILVKGSEPQKGYNIVLVTKQDASVLNKGDKISFHGRIGNLSTWHGESLDIAGEFSKGSQ